MQFPTRAFALILCVLIPVSTPLWAVETRTWEQADAADFEKGTLTKLSLSSDGRLTPSPVLKEILDPSVTFLWAIARDSKGNLYAGGGGVGGSKAKLIQVDSAGKSKTLAELEGLAIQAIAIDKQDRVYAATSPDGKVYRVDAAGKSEVFYDPHAKYIWALAFSSKGDLYVATGDSGEIHKVTAAGAGSVFYRTEEANARSLAIDTKDNLIVGTEPSGLVLRISPAGDGFVLYESPKREITAIAIGSDGAVYAAGTGNKQAVAPAVSAATAPPRNPQANQGAVTVVVPAARPTTTLPSAAAPPSIPGGSEVYRVQPDGYPRRIWNSAQDVVYALAINALGQVIAGTGNGGNIYRLDTDHSSTRLLSLGQAQVTAFAGGPGGRIYLVTGNIGEIYSLGPEREASGTLESEVLDAGAFSYWGRLTSLVTGPGSVAFETRSGNVSRTQKDWSSWAQPSDGRITSPPARFLQYRAVITGIGELYDVAAAYETKNVPPVIEVIESTPANYKFPAPSSAPPAPQVLALPPIGASAPAPRPSTDSGVTPPLTYAKGQIGARWIAVDENGDALLFNLEIRGENETAWKPLRDNVREHYYSWDSTAFPDGKYRLRITASDAPSNPAGEALTASLESYRFLIDNTPPEITGLTSSVSGAGIEVRFHSKDAWNVLGKAEYSVNGGEWKVVEPTTRLTDSEEHDYRFNIGKAQGETTIAVRIADAYDNQASAKTVVK